MLSSCIFTTFLLLNIGEQTHSPRCNRYPLSLTQFIPLIHISVCISKLEHSNSPQSRQHDFCIFKWRNKDQVDNCLLEKKKSGNEKILWCMHANFVCLYSYNKQIFISFWKKWLKEWKCCGLNLLRRDCTNESFVFSIFFLCFIGGDDEKCALLQKTNLFRFLRRDYYASSCSSHFVHFGRLCCRLPLHYLYYFVLHINIHPTCTFYNFFNTPIFGYYLVESRTLF